MLLVRPIVMLLQLVVLAQWQSTLPLVLSLGLAGLKLVAINRCGQPLLLLPLLFHALVLMLQLVALAQWGVL
jgi:hypothetical protein